jgi:alpha,alpha-trehalose phosphorylase
VLAHFLYREESTLIMRRTYEYYEQVTTHDSSLSACVFSMMAARLGDLGGAKGYFELTVGIDIEDQSGNTRDGLHIANMGGAYLSIIAGFGGMRLDDSGLRLFPLLPEGWAGYSFTLALRGSRVFVSVNPDGCELRILEGEDREVMVFDRRICVSKTKIQINRPVRAFIFDLDGVVTDTARYHFAAWKRIADELEIPFDKTNNERFKGVSRAECMKLLLEIGGRSMPHEEAAIWLNKKNLYYMEELSSLFPDDILPGVTEALTNLREQNIRCGLFSVSKNSMFILERIGLQNAFDAIVDGNDITHSKPHYEGYLLTAERLGVDARLCFMVEDAEAGLVGAKALSMRTIGIGTKYVADYNLIDTQMLPELIGRIISE